MRLYRSCFHISDPLNREEHTRQTPNVLRFRRRLRSRTIPLISADTFLLPDTNPGPLGDWIRRAFDIQSLLLPRRLRGRFHHTPPPDRSSALRFNFPPLHFHPALVSRPAAAGRALLLLWHGAIVAAICIGRCVRGFDPHSHRLGQKAVVSVRPWKWGSPKNIFCIAAIHPSHPHMSLSTFSEVSVVFLIGGLLTFLLLVPAGESWGLLRQHGFTILAKHVNFIDDCTKELNSLVFSNVSSMPLRSAFHGGDSFQWSRLSEDSDSAHSSNYVLKAP